MSIKSRLSKPFAKRAVKKMQWWIQNPVETQNKLLKELIQNASKTKFGKNHNFSSIQNYHDFREAIPVKDYEGLKPYIKQVIEGKEDILWKGKPLYLSKTSGTTSGAKYIPISKESMPYHIKAARNALLSYINETGKVDFIDGKMIFLQGSPVLNSKNGIDTGRLSGIVAHHVPQYLQKNRLPSYETNCIEDWETKVDKIIEETVKEDMRLISGIPSWVQMYFEKILEKTGKENILEVFPNFSLFVYGGVNFKPYENRFRKLIGDKIPSIETYPASEGFIAFQDSQNSNDLLLLLDSGIFYEFIPVEEFFNEHPTRVNIEQVELGINYAIILNTNAGLWGYNIGDTVMFTSIKPYKIVVTGRIKHFISAFGEHVIAKEVETAIREVSFQNNTQVIEFTVAPQVNPIQGELPYHEWFIEFETPPSDIKIMAEKMDEIMQEQNIYYKDLIQGNILQQLIIRPIKKGGFTEMMKKRGKLGGQNKIPKLTNSRDLANLLEEFIEF